MEILLEDRHGRTSPCISFSADENEFMNQVEIWRANLLKWAEKQGRSTPLSRLEVEVCFTDLLRHLTHYYTATTDSNGRILGTVRVHRVPVDSSKIIFLYGRE